MTEPSPHIAPMLARQDPSLRARVVARRPLLYDAGADPGQDRPAHVRAGSALALVGRRLVVLQDDALFLGLVDLERGSVEAIALPAAPGGVRCFDEGRGNKAAKPDFEACVVHGDRLLAFGSGSTPARERVLVVGDLGELDRRSAPPAVQLIEAHRLYAALRAEPRFAGSELNIEGAVVVGGSLRLFQRGNGAARGDLQPVDATCELDLPDLLRYLEPGRNSDPPQVHHIVQYDLGTMGGVRLTFTDAAAQGEDILYLAAAEASPDAVQDGPVAGVALGLIPAAAGPPHWTPLLDQDGRPFSSKAEGLAPDPHSPGTLHLVVDRDDPDAPAELCRVELEGFRL